MYVVIIVLTVLVAILLIGIVLIQKSKGGGLSSQFGGAGTMMGVRQTNSFLEKATWTLAALIAILSIVSAFVMPGNNSHETAVRTTTETSAPAMPGNQFDSKAAPAKATETPAAAAPATEAPAAEAPAAAPAAEQPAAE
jgi:preprotein translocase subunit SecG